MGFKPRGLARRLALALVESHRIERLLADDVLLRIWRWDGAEAFRSRGVVLARLADEAAAWIDPAVSVLEVTTGRSRAVAELQIVEGPRPRRMRHERCLIATARGGRATNIDLYCAQPIPHSPRTDMIVPATCSDDELGNLLARQANGDTRRPLPSGRHRYVTTDLMWSGCEQTDPILNRVWNARWSAASADRRIAEVVAWHRGRGRGLLWRCDSFDEPADLGERLERHGFVPTARLTTMALRLPDAPPIPVAPDVELRAIDADDTATQRLALDIVGCAFEFTEARVTAMWPTWAEEMRATERPYPRRHYLAYLDGRAVGFGALSLCGGTAQLTGAGVIPDARRRGVYTTLLARRLDDAVAHGYEIASIEAEAPSRRVVERFGFRAFNDVRSYELPPPEPD